MAKNKKDDAVAITKIELKVGGKTIPLSLDEARELKGILSELFNDNTMVKKVYLRDYYPWWWNTPFYGTVTCGSTVDSSTWKGNTAGETLYLTSGTTTEIT